jgi:ABC-type dipeptide/oligopeptide/nickel transport system permease subunit
VSGETAAVPAALAMPIEPARGRVRAGSVLRRHAAGVIAGVVIVLLVAVALAAPLVAPYSATESVPGETGLQDPSWDHPAGTDLLGRDVLSRTIYGARVSLGVAVVAVALGTAFGVVAGLASGYAGGIQDRISQTMLDIGLAFPGLVALLAIGAAFGRSLNVVTPAIAALSVPVVMRVVRGSVIKEKDSLYVEAARAVGASDARVILRHILPNIAAVIIVLASALVPSAIMAEASLSFLGFGVQPPTPSWGGDLSKDARQYFEQQPWLALAPGIALSVTVLAFNLLGDTLRDVLDPRLRGSK